MQNNHDRLNIPGKKRIQNEEKKIKKKTHDTKVNELVLLHGYVPSQKNYKITKYFILEFDGLRVCYSRALIFH